MFSLTCKKNIIILKNRYVVGVAFKIGMSNFNAIFRLKTIYVTAILLIQICQNNNQNIDHSEQ